MEQTKIMSIFSACKVLKARRRNGIDDRHSVYISKELAHLIENQIVDSEAIRNKHNVPYIFLHQNDSYEVSMLNIEYFAVEINGLIEKHHICDESGEIWYFTSRQCRETLVVNMIENGVTVNELVYQLGHLSQSTVMQYYAEVRSVRLAEMNTELFKKQFDVLLSEKQLENFSEKERRLLYVDFRLGFCTRKL